MAVDWDAALLGPVMDVFGEGDPADAFSWPEYRPRGGQPFQLRGAVFDAEYLQVDADESGAPTSTTMPVLGVRLALFARPPASLDKVYVPSVAKLFAVKVVQPDGHGWAKLLLMESEG